MKILVDILHPAHVHFFKIPIKKWKEMGHEVLIVTRAIEICEDLLKYNTIKYISTGKKGESFFGLIIELLKRTFKITRLIRKEKINILVGIGGINISLAGFLKRKPRIIFTDSEFAHLANKITFPLATKIYTPTFFYRNIGKKQVKYRSFHEFSYLNPKYFKPDINILKKLNIKSKSYFILRFSDWKASHDIKQTGFSYHIKKQIIGELKQHGKVFISSEGNLPIEFKEFDIKLEPHELHSFLSYSSLLVSETQTTTTESALLGVPVVRYNSLTKSEKMRSGNMDEIEKAGLVFNFEDENEALKKIKEILQSNISDDYWKEKRDILIKDLVDPIPIIVNSIEIIKNK